MEASRDEVHRCKYYEGLFSPYIEGDLEPQQRQALAEHIKDCETCSEKFGMSWRALAQADSNPKRFGARAKRKRSLPQSRLLWILLGASLIGLLLLSASGLLGEGAGLSPLRRGRKSAPRLVDEEIARMLTLDNRLLTAMVEILQRPDQTISHAARGEAKDFVDRWNLQQDLLVDRELASHLLLHSLLRAVDLAPGGLEWDRKSYLQKLREGRPKLVLISVDNVTRDSLALTAAYGERAARLILVREEFTGEELSDGQRADRLRLAWIALTKP